MLPRAAIAFGTIHVARGGLHRHQDAECQQESSSSTLTSAVGAVVVGAAGLGLYAWRDQTRERDAMVVVQLSLSGQNDVQSLATTFATRVKDRRVRSSTTTRKEIQAQLPSASNATGSDTEESESPDNAVAWASAVTSAVQDQIRSERISRILVVAPPDVVALLGRKQLGKLAGLVERTLPGGEVHGLSPDHQGRLTLAALKNNLQTQALTLDVNTPTGLVCSVGDGDVQVFGSGALVSGDTSRVTVGSNNSNNSNKGDAKKGGQDLASVGRASEDEPQMVPCGDQGRKLLWSKGPEVAGQLYEWHCRKHAANVLRRASNGQQIDGHFVLAGEHTPSLLGASLQPANSITSLNNSNKKKSSSSSSSSSQGSSLAVWPGVLKRDEVLERLQGEAAALEQWLKLAEQVKDSEDLEEVECVELLPQARDIKRARLASAIALIAVLDVGFHKHSTFQVLHAGGSSSGGSRGGGGGGVGYRDAVAEAWPLGLYLEQRQK